MNTKNIFLLVFIVLGGWSVRAQETISKDVHVVREYAPTISDAQKLNQMPQREDTLKVTPQFSYQVLGKAMVTTPEITPISPASLASEPQNELFPSYVRGGLGNYQLLFGDIYYNLLRNESFAMALKLRQESSWGDLDLENGKSVDAPYHQTEGTFYLRHFFNDKTLSLDLDFDRYAYRYYGLERFDPDGSYQLPKPVDGTDLVASSDLIPDNSQRFSSFDVNLELAGQQSDIRQTRYRVGLGLGTFGNKTGVGENRVSLMGDLKIPFDSFLFALTGGIDYYRVSEPSENESPYLWNFSDRQQTFIKLNPRVVFNRDLLSVEGGLNFTGILDDLDDEFFLSPHLTANLVVAEGIVTAFGGVTGDVRSANYEQVIKENPFISPDVHVKSAFSNLLFFAGVKGNFSSATSFSARVDYEFLENEHFFVNRSFVDELSIEKNFGVSNLFDVVYDDGTLLTLSGELLIKPTSNFSVLLKGAYFDWSLDRLIQPWHKPDMELGLRTQYTLDEHLLLSAAFNVLGKRSAQDLNALDGIKTLASVADFNLGADYQFSSRLNLFAKVQNIFADKYYRWSGYPMQGINFRIGAGYSF